MCEGKFRMKGDERHIYIVESLDEDFKRTEILSSKEGMILNGKES